LKQQVFDELLTHFKTCKKKQLMLQLDEIFTFLAQQNISYLYAQHTLMQLLTMIGNVARERQIADPALNKNTLLTQLRDVESLEECRQWIVTLVEIYLERVGTQIGLIDEQFIASISQYIIGNIDQDISLSKVAEHFNITSSYLSKIFKENIGINFSHFVTAHKLQKASELLRNDNKMNISQVASSLGYYNLPYFSMLFKEKYGVTPVKFRKQNCAQ